MEAIRTVEPEIALLGFGVLLAVIFCRQNLALLSGSVLLRGVSACCFLRGSGSAVCAARSELVAGPRCGEEEGAGGSPCLRNRGVLVAGIYR